ncbi:hypothetical protein E2562_033485 [Oryza meyeriana var. granulata]|uniref:Uncharacterized protein n=1 Tax=Oryza meyeriana var. granulata TaxID=110450 RepID=A0A6G1F100_9ORYZ|nr:hypothetical protein E2562_033485 [Oryza meyeriana var. granulata]
MGLTLGWEGCAGEEELPGRTVGGVRWLGRAGRPGGARPTGMSTTGGEEVVQREGSAWREEHVRWGGERPAGGARPVGRGADQMAGGKCVLSLLSFPPVFARPKRDERAHGRGVLLRAGNLRALAHCGHFPRARASEPASATPPRRLASRIAA